MDSKNEKEAAGQQIKSAAAAEKILSLVGVPTGYAISYCFQSGLLRAFYSLGEYFRNVGKVITDKHTAPTAIIVTVIVSIIFEVIGRSISSRAKRDAASVLSHEEIHKYARTGAGNIVFGRIKDGEDTAAGSVKRIIMMLLVGIGIIFLVLVLLVVLLAR